jgi:hypothetical protein
MVQLLTALENLKITAENGTTKLGTSANNTEIEADGTMRANGDATTFDDVNTGFSAGKVPPQNAPTWAEFSANTASYTFDIDDYIDLATLEIPHSYKEGSDVEIHLHIVNNGTDTTERKAKYRVFFIWACPNHGSSGFDTEQYLDVEFTFPANVVDKRSWVLGFGIIPDSANMKMGCQVKTRVKRIACSTTEPTKDPFVGQLGLHFESDTLGSRQRYVK